MTPAPVHLSPREREIARLMAEGLGYGAIARRLGWRRDSVRRQAQTMANKLQAWGKPSVIIVAWWREHEQDAA